MNQVDKIKLILNLKQIKKSIILGAGGGVTDTAWMFESPCETIVERIDSMLVELGENLEELEMQNCHYEDDV